MRRREFIALLGGTALWPLPTRAQQPQGNVARIGFITANSEADAEQQTRSAAFLDALAKLGWSDGHNLKIHYRWGANTAELRQTYAKELISLGPNVIVAQSSLNTEALQ